ncbi:MAG: hypothetical protein NC350_02115 [Corallococcus sp.]|nr:hypothetical protein [Corallococcus sp.]
MKKSAIFSLVLALAMLFAAFTTVAFAEESTAPSAGNFYQYDAAAENNKGTIISSSTNNVFYTNKHFVYIPQTGTDYVVAEITKEQVKDFVNGKSNGTEIVKISGYATSVDALLDFSDEASPTTKYLAVADKLEGENFYSKTKVVCYDTVAPQIDETKLTEYLENADAEHGFNKAQIGASKELKLPTEWIEDVNILTEETAVVTEENKDEETETTRETVTKNDTALLVVSFEYLAPNDYYNEKSEWSSQSTSISATTLGQWRFRYVIKDRAGNEVTSNHFTREVTKGATAPEITLTSSQLKVQTTGTTAGKTYTIPTPTVSGIGCSASYTYKVSKLVDGKYVVILDSDTKEVTEGYESFITSNGVLTPAANEITTRTGDTINYIYKVDYEAVDDYGFVNTLTLNILTTAPDAETSAVDIWKIVFIVIACLSAVGLILLIFIKPKQKTESTNGRVHYGEETEQSEEKPSKNKK